MQQAEFDRGARHDQGHRQHRRVRPLPPAAAVRRGRRLRLRRRQGHPRPWPPTTRTPPPWASRPPAWPCGGPRAPPRRRCGSPPPPRPTSTRPTPPPSTPPCASPADVAAFDFGGAAALGPRRPAHRPRRRRPGTTPGGAWPTCATGCPGSADESRRRRRRRRRRWSATTARARRWSPSTWAAPRSATSSSTAGGPRATAAPRMWEERFGETRYVPLGAEAWQAGAEGGRA